MIICEVPPPERFEQAVEIAAEKFNIDGDLIRVIANRESRCQQHVIGAAGEVGLMQINPGVWRDEPYNWNRLYEGTGLSWDAVHTVDGNIMMGAWVLQNAIRVMSGDLRKGVALYNGYSEAGLAYADAVLDTYNKVKMSKGRN
tara:strand:- start:178 stop:606 length:429 start_codon:yes stop_codon:yes gene_type:complete